MKVRLLARLIPGLRRPEPAREPSAELVRALTDFASRRCFIGGDEQHDPDVLSAYNLALEAAYQAIRRIAAGRD